MAGGTAVSIPQVGEEFLGHGLYVARARLGYGDPAATSNSDGLDIWTDTQETAEIFAFNSSDVFVHALSWDVETAFTASVTITLGDTADVDGYASAADIAATVISSGAPAADTTSVFLHGGRRYGDTAVGIDAVVGGADPAVGVLNVYCLYSYAPGYAQPDSGGSANT
jgi:hypothetical protein